MVIHRSIVKGLNPYCLYKGFELVTKDIGRLVGEQVGLAILSSHFPASLLQPIIHDTKTKSLLLAMSDLAKKGQ